MSVKSELVVDIERLLKKFKRGSRLFIAKFIRKHCPSTLRNFDRKYPEVGKFKNDISRMGVLTLVRLIFVFVVLPVISVFAICNYTNSKIKSLFNRKSEK